MLFYEGLRAGLSCHVILILRDATLCVVDNEALMSLSAKAATRLYQVFHPKTHGAHLTMFRTFVAFCVYTKCLDIKIVLSFLECLVIIDCSTSMTENYVSAIKAHFVLYDLYFAVFEHPKLKYFLKALRINRPVSVKPHNIISVDRLAQISAACENFTSGLVYRAVFFSSFFSASFGYPILPLML